MKKYFRPVVSSTMKKIFSIILTGGIFFLVSTSQVQAGWGQWVKVTSIAVDNDGILVGFSAESNPMTCPGRTKAYLVPNEVLNFKETYAAILAAFLSGKEVLVYDGDVPVCGEFARIFRIQVR